MGSQVPRAKKGPAKAGPSLREENHEKDHAPLLTTTIVILLGQKQGDKLEDQEEQIVRMVSEPAVSQLNP